MADQDPINPITLAVRLANIDNKLDGLAASVVELQDRLDQGFVTKIEFLARVPLLEKIVFGLIALAGTAVVGALLKVVLVK